MSAFLTLATPMTDRACLIAALADMGFAEAKLELHDQAVPLVGFEGRARTQVAHVIIRRQHVGSSSNDIGFEWTPTGYRAHVSDFDRPRFGPAWLATLRASYEKHDRAKQERLAREAREAAEIEARRAAAAEAHRRAQARLRLIEAQRQAVHENAKKLGYRVQETRQGDSVRLVLVKRTY